MVNLRLEVLEWQPLNRVDLWLTLPGMVNQVDSGPPAANLDQGRHEEDEELAGRPCASSGMVERGEHPDR